MRPSFFSTGAVSLLVGALMLEGCTPVNHAYVSVPATGAIANGDSVRTVWSSLPNGTSKTYMRRGLNCGGCLVPVEIAPVGKEEEFDPANPPSGQLIVAHVINRGGVATEMYGFLPSSDDYFLVGKDSTGAATWSIAHVARAAHGSVTIVKGKGVEGCHHPKATKPAAAFQTCDGAQHPSMRPSLSQLASRGMDWIVAHVLRMAAEDPAWVACADGCCTMDSAS